MSRAEQAAFDVNGRRHKLRQIQPALSITLQASVNCFVGLFLAIEFSQFSYRTFSRNVNGVQSSVHERRVCMTHLPARRPSFFGIPPLARAVLRDRPASLAMAGRDRRLN